MIALPTPYYHDSVAGITLYCGDCREIVPLLEPVDLVLTDPPYGVNKGDWDILPQGVIKMLWHLTRGGMLVFWSAFDLVRIPSEVGTSPKNTIVWWKPNLPALWMFDRSRLASQWEPCFYFAKPGYEPVQRPTDVWTCAYPANSPARQHPTQKPLGLVIRMLQTFPGALVLDPFCGSGTTLVAAKQLGRRAIGIEISEIYCEIAVKRLAQSVLLFPPKIVTPAPQQAGLFAEEP